MSEVRYVEHDGVRLGLHDSGRSADLPTVVLLHSLFFDGTMFDRLIDELGPVARFLRPDHRGQGTSQPAGGAVDMDTLAADTAALIRWSTDSPVHLVGSSMGAYVALRVLLRHPELVASCILLGATAADEERPEKFAALEHRLRTEGPAACADQLLQLMFGDTFLTADAHVSDRDRWHAAFAGRGPAIADALRGVYTRGDLRSELSSIDLPLLLIAGAQDRAKSPADLAAVADRVRGSTLVVLDDAGHTPVVEAPAAVARELRAWWAQHPPTISPVEQRTP